MFQGSEHAAKGDHIRTVEDAGGTMNGSTTNDRTNYYEVIPKNYLETALWLESDRMGYLLPALGQDKLDNQRDVVKNERRLSVDNQPYGRASEVVSAALVPRVEPVFVASDRVDGGPVGRERRRRQAILPLVLRAGQRRAVDLRRHRRRGRPRCSSSAISAPSRVGRTSHAPRSAPASLPSRAPSRARRPEVDTPAAVVCVAERGWVESRRRTGWRRSDACWPRTARAG